MLVLSVVMIAFGRTPGAMGTQDAPINAGQLNTETKETVVQNIGANVSGCAAIVANGLLGCGDWGVEGLGATRGVFGQGSTSGVYGKSGTSNVTGPDVATGVWGDSDQDGIWGTGARNGVVGRTANDAASGVYGENQGTGYGVAGRANTGTGVFADTQSGTSLLATAVGGTAVNASVGAGGTGIKTKAPNSGTALTVMGKAKFSRSGVVTIAAGANSQAITLAGANSNSMVLATAQQTSSVSVKAAVPGNGSFTIYLTGSAPTNGLKVAYFVLN